MSLPAGVKDSTGHGDWAKSVVAEPVLGTLGGGGCRKTDPECVCAQGLRRKGRASMRNGRRGLGPSDLYKVPWGTQ